MQKRRGLYKIHSMKIYHVGIEEGKPEQEHVLSMGMYLIVSQSEITALVEYVPENLILGYKDKDIYVSG